MEFRVIDHTADLGIEVRAKTLEELFEGAAYGMMSLIVDPHSVEGNIKKEVIVDAEDLEGLMFTWLNELIYIINVEGVLFSGFDVTLDGTKLKATLSCEKFDPKRHKIKDEIKAATYHDLSIEKKNGDWEVRVIFDV